jgi:hypothetical protein
VGVCFSAIRAVSSRPQETADTSPTFAGYEEVRRRDSVQGPPGNFVDREMWRRSRVVLRRFAGILMELAGLEPATSWVRFGRSPALNLLCLQGFRAGEARSVARDFGQFPLVSAGIGPKKPVLGPISHLPLLRLRRFLPFHSPACRATPVGPRTQLLLVRSSTRRVRGGSVATTRLEERAGGDTEARRLLPSSRSSTPSLRFLLVVAGPDCQVARLPWDTRAAVPPFLDPGGGNRGRPVHLGCRRPDHGASPPVRSANQPP